MEGSFFCLCSSSDIIRELVRRDTTLTRHVALMHVLRDSVNLNGTVISERTLQKEGVAQYREDMVADSFERGNTISDFITGRECFDYLIDYYNFACGSVWV
jgi:hypothetical protein